MSSNAISPSHFPGQPSIPHEFEEQPDDSEILIRSIDDSDQIDDSSEKFRSIDDSLLHFWEQRRRVFEKCSVCDEKFKQLERFYICNSRLHAFHKEGCSDFTEGEERKCPTCTTPLTGPF